MEMGKDGGRHMLTTVEGVYEDGQVELNEQPRGVRKAKVLVTFLDDQEESTSQMMELGVFAGPIETSEEDFKLAEWHGDPDDGLDWTGA
jgi:hypothetical protein